MGKIIKIKEEGIQITDVKKIGDNLPELLDPEFRGGSKEEKT